MNFEFLDQIYPKKSYFQLKTEQAVQALQALQAFTFCCSKC